ncbi:MAG TPA: PAS domain-containing sensor histidine kinase [Terriglobales bacterium]|nr:PAS domain-containing sensor histidine kinase [Terriglobales bacterium]
MPSDRVSPWPAPPADDAFRLLVSHVQEYAIFMLDPNGVISSWNEGAARIKGYPENEIVGKHFSVLYERADIDANKPDRHLLMAERLGQVEDQGWRLRSDGTRFWASVVITALRDETGALRGFGKVTRDVSDRMIAEQQRREAEELRDHAERLAQLEKAKSDFLNVASHELRAPLTVLRGYTSMFEDGTLSSDKLPDVLPVLSGKLEQMETLVQRMLETARMEINHIERRRELLDVRGLVVPVVDSFRKSLNAAHTLTLVLPDAPIVVSADPRLLEIVVSNLVDNAIKYTPEGGPIRCEVAQSRGLAYVSVEDRGIGIPRDAMGRLFGRFGRIVTDDNAHIVGTGLGLYLAREIARHHSGDILVESREGHGSRFTLVLPMVTHS